MGIVRLHVSLLASLLWASPGQARAGDADLPAIDPPGHARVMTHEDASSTSKCVGNAITPLCAVETVIACFERRDGELCRIGMGLDERLFFENIAPEPRPYVYVKYRVLSAKRYGEHDLPPPHHLSPAATPPPWWFTEDRRQYRAGDVEIVVLEQTCWRNRRICNAVFVNDRRTYHLRRMGDRWAVLIWKSPDPRYEKITREKF